MMLMAPLNSIINGAIEPDSPNHSIGPKGSNRYIEPIVPRGSRLNRPNGLNHPISIGTHILSGPSYSTTITTILLAANFTLAENSRLLRIAITFVLTVVL